jgi:hypothetical protein
MDDIETRDWWFPWEKAEGYLFTALPVSGV